MDDDGASRNIEKSNEDTIPETQKATITFDRDSWAVVSERWEHGGKKRISVKNVLRPWHNEKLLSIFMH
eukprot:8941411-Karenia_brevis.AAC.1